MPGYHPSFRGLRIRSPIVYTQALKRAQRSPVCLCVTPGLYTHAQNSPCFTVTFTENPRSKLHLPRRREPFAPAHQAPSGCTVLCTVEEHSMCLSRRPRPWGATGSSPFTSRRQAVSRLFFEGWRRNLCLPVPQLSLHIPFLGLTILVLGII